MKKEEFVTPSTSTTTSPFKTPFSENRYIAETPGSAKRTNYLDATFGPKMNINEDTESMELGNKPYDVNVD